MADAASIPIRDQALHLVQTLPPDASWDDLMYHIYVRQAIDAGLSDADAGRVADVAEVAAMHELVLRESQFIIATHSPIIMAYPNATIYEFGDHGIRQLAYKDTEHYRVMHAFLNRPEQTLRMLLEEGDD